MPVDAMGSPELRKEFLFHALARAHFNAQQAGLNRQGLSNLGSPRLLFSLMDLNELGYPTPSQRKLADLLRISPATIATSLKSLEKAGYVTRRPDEKDGRKNLVFITEKGREAVLTSRCVLNSVDSHMYFGFSTEERQQLQQFHQRMLENLYQIGGDDDPPCCPPPPPPRFPRKDD